jgi:hypothetical protein
MRTLLTIRYYIFKIILKSHTNEAKLKVRTQAIFLSNSDISTQHQDIKKIVKKNNLKVTLFRFIYQLTIF